MEYDFFLSRRGSVAALAQEVTGILEAKGYKIFAQDYDIPLTANFIEAMHDGIKTSRDLLVLFTSDYESSPYTRKEFSSFEADRVQSTQLRRIVILRCEDVPLRGLFAPNVYQDLTGVDEPQERKARILAAIGGHSQAYKPAPRPFIGVPPQIHSFTGRVHELDRLDNVLVGHPPAETQTVRQLGRAAICGMGGVGKTALAIEYAYRYRDLYAGIWWCPAETRIGLLTALAGMAKDLGAALPGEADIEQAAKAGLRRLAEQPAIHLLIYDNAVSPADIQDLLPASGARILITSRFADWDGWADEVGVDVLHPSEASEFLQSRAGRQDAPGAAALSAALGYLPLALDHAAAYCKRNQTGFGKYASNVNRLTADLPTGTIYPRSVRATFDLAIAAAIAQKPAADQLMAFLAQCAPERVPLDLLEGALADEFESADALLAITDMSLAKRDPFEDGTPAVSLHRLVRTIALDRADKNETAGPAASRLSGRLFALYPRDGRDDPKCWPPCQRLTPHVLSQADNLEFSRSPAPEQALLLNRTGNYLHGRGEFSRALPLLTKALDIRERHFGPAHADTARSLNNVANLLQDLGKLEEALPLRERALAIFTAELGADHPTTATSLNNLGFLLQQQGNLTRARPIYEQALAICQAALDPNDPDIAISMNNLGTLLQAQGNLVSAQEMLAGALAIREKSLGPKHPYTALSLGNLANLLEAQGMLEKADAHFARALAIREEILGPEHPDTASSLIDMARIAASQNRPAAAEMRERAAEIRRTTLGPEHPLTLEAQTDAPVRI